MQKLVYKRIPLPILMNLIVCVSTHADQIVKTEAVCDLTLVTEPVYVPTHPDWFSGRSCLISIHRRFTNYSPLVYTYVSCRTSLFEKRFGLRYTSQPSKAIKNALSQTEYPFEYFEGGGNLPHSFEVDWWGQQNESASKVS